MCNQRAFGDPAIRGAEEDAVVRSYLQETLTFRVLTSEASVVLAPSAKIQAACDGSRYLHRDLS
jgi:hypothetical protein